METRKNTKKLLDMVKDRQLDPYQVILACVNYMSEAEVADMCNLNDFFYEDEDDD